MIWKALNLHSLEALVGCLYHLGQTLQVESGRLDDVVMVVRVHYQACEGIFEQIQIPRGSLDVGEALRVRGLM